MQTIITNQDSPPPLLLALQVLKNMTADPHGKAAPLAVGVGNTTVIDLAKIDQKLGAAKTAETVSFLTLFGQMLWRYIPAVLELDSQRQGAILSHRNLASTLPDGNSFTVLNRSVMPLLQRRSLLKRSAHAASKQEHESDHVPRQRVRLQQPDHRILSDYSTVRTRSTHFLTANGALSLDQVKLSIDKNWSGQRNVLRDLQIGKKLYSKGIYGPPPRRQWDSRPLPANLRSVNIVNEPATVGMTPLDAVSVLPSLTQSARRQDVICDHQNPFLATGELRNGVFFRSPIFNAKLEPIGGDTFGFVDLNTKPFEVTLNSRMAYPRTQMSFVHEMLHVMMEMHKIQMPHDKIHQLALVLMNEILPGLSALAKYTNNPLI